MRREGGHGVVCLGDAGPQADVQLAALADDHDDSGQGGERRLVHGGVVPQPDPWLAIVGGPMALSVAAMVVVGDLQSIW